MGNVFASSNFVRKTSEHLLASLSTVLLLLAAEETYFNVVDFDLGNNSTCPLDLVGSELASSIMRCSRPERYLTDKVFSYHEHRVSDLLVAFSRVGCSL